MNWKKLAQQIKEKLMVTAVVFMLTTGATFLYNNGRELWNLPGTVKEMNNMLRQMKITHTRDSIMAVSLRDEFNMRIIRLERRSRRDSTLREDVHKIKHKLKLY